jgi:hypothetical protein
MKAEPMDLVLDHATALQVEATRHSLRFDGYQDLTEHDGPIHIGTRIRHRSHQWPEAVADGTGTVAWLMHLPRAHTIGETPAIELIVVWDEPLQPHVYQVADHDIQIIIPVGHIT